MTLFTELRAYDFGELAFLLFFGLMALTSFIPGLWITDRRSRKEKLAHQARIDAAHPLDPIAARRPHITA